MTTVWQIAAGDSARDYSQMLVDHDVMIMGPGEYGSMKDDGRDYQEAILSGQVTSAKVKAIEHFYADVKPGDTVLLRRGYRVIAIGLIEDDTYKWDERFDDVYGWDLQHTRRVIWQHQLTPQLDQIQRHSDLFGGRKQIPTFTRVREEKVLAPIRDLLSQCNTRPLKLLPEPPGDLLSDEEVGNELFSRGLSLRAVDQLLKAIGRQRRMLQWYEQHGRASHRPTEHEVVAYMVLPMMLSLGWSEQLLAVEWHKVDLAAFRRTPTTPSDCVLVCEAKGIRHGLQNAFQQAVKYVENLQLNDCHKMTLTQGGRFYLF